MNDLVTISFELNTVIENIHINKEKFKKSSDECIVQENVSEIKNQGYDFTGRHDHGPLPSLLNEGYNADLIKALQEAKAECDRYLTSQINNKNNNSTTSMNNEVQDLINSEMDICEDFSENISKKSRVTWYLI